MHVSQVIQYARRSMYERAQYSCIVTLAYWSLLVSVEQAFGVTAAE